MARVIKVAVKDKRISVGKTSIRVTDDDAAVKIGLAVLALAGFEQQALPAAEPETKLALVSDEAPEDEQEKPKRKKRRRSGIIGNRRAKEPPPKLASDEKIVGVLKPREGEGTDEYSTRIMLEGGARALDILRKFGR